MLVLRWSGRLAALVLVGIVAAIVVGHGGLPNVLGQLAGVQVEFVGLCLCVAGCVAGWRWQVPGAILAIAGFGLFLATELIVNGRFPGGLIPFFLVNAPVMMPAIARIVPQHAACNMSFRYEPITAASTLE